MSDWTVIEPLVEEKFRLEEKKFEFEKRKYSWAIASLVTVVMSIATVGVYSFASFSQNNKLERSISQLVAEASKSKENFMVLESELVKVGYEQKLLLSRLEALESANTETKSTLSLWVERTQEDIKTINALVKEGTK
ncbi:hypothetical protein [Shewanella sp. YLB-07]|uniref:hypothetical protein n=1 Tax=Shewanella sp. YLB-07 TaxID=2601268 RepID=UPI00128E2669|nr:hypothetical protein [Shewanella sp. YLB-07]MPY25164.1 hypothetical protein [Shewanella sp. YLB-07]